MRAHSMLNRKAFSPKLASIAMSSRYRFKKSHASPEGSWHGVDCRCSHHHQSLFVFCPSTWCADTAAPNRKLSGNRKVSVIRRSVPQTSTSALTRGRWRLPIYGEVDFPSRQRAPTGLRSPLSRFTKAVYDPLSLGGEGQGEGLKP